MHTILLVVCVMLYSALCVVYILQYDHTLTYSHYICISYFHDGVRYVNFGLFFHFLEGKTTSM